MSCKPVASRKTLLRNTKQAAPQLTKIYNNASHRHEIIPTATLNKRVATPKTVSRSNTPLVSDVDLSLPTQNTTKKILDDIAKLKFDPAKKQPPKIEAIDATKQMNFLPNEPVFKNLIPLSKKHTIPSEKKSQRTSARTPQSKDSVSGVLKRTPSARSESTEFYYNKVVSAQAGGMVKDYNGFKSHHMTAAKNTIHEAEWNT